MRTRDRFLEQRDAKEAPRVVFVKTDVAFDLAVVDTDLAYIADFALDSAEDEIADAVGSDPASDDSGEPAVADTELAAAVSDNVLAVLTWVDIVPVGDDTVLAGTDSLLAEADSL
jgi:hypothetical protein